MRKKTHSNDMAMETKEIACKLTTPELQERKATVLAELKLLTIERKEMKEGYAFRFEGSDQNLDKLIEFVKTERACCDFFIFNLTIEEGTAWLKITGPEGAKEFMENEMRL